ncbi:diacylglycerol kinase [Deferribacter desulfuricans SSM1]|uniref:Diacylglycerol kinase n=1 Tax=Deferribacter desulfuricans (strain DSM 14783 / JCM 11476 / NBRC 101012 / SSM1) TaxID=639282 RepID=D3PD76_DEFDS|nr:diacylglycerol kinase [Deferribacter desulfuricans]BAI80549.1 diacylglycerol kinase [Deferribacter desulfuricans SSM1]
MKSDSWWKSVGFAIEGIIYAVRHERNLRIHIALAVLVLFVALFFKLKFLEYIILAITISLVIAAELFNTAIEYTIDFVCKEKCSEVKHIKDVAAGAVLTTAFGAVFVGYFVLFDKIKEYAGFALKRLPDLPSHLAVMSLVITVLFVVILKAIFGKGEPLHGGMPSGHAATAFSVFISTIYLTKNITEILLVFLLAILVSQSRVQLGIHNTKEVVVGAFLGASVTYLLYNIFLGG